METVVLFSALALAFGLGMVGIRRHPVQLLTVLVAWFAIQQFAVNLVWAIAADAGLSQALILWKEAAIAGAFVGVLPRLFRELRARTIWVGVAAAFAGLLVIYTIVTVTGQPLDQTARGLRSLAFPFVLAVVGFASISEAAQGKAFADRVILIGVAVAAFAIFERVIIPDSFWRAIDIRGYWIEVKGLSPNTISPLDLPGNYYAYFAGPGTEIRRAVGSLGDPLGLSYFLVTPLLIIGARATNANKQLSALGYAVMASLLAIAIGLSVSRLSALVGAAGVIAIAIMSLIASGRARTSWVRAATTLIPALALAATFVAMIVIAGPIGFGQGGSLPPVTPEEVFQDPSAQSHVDRILGADPAAFVLGAGPGSYGILASVYTSQGTDVATYENVFLDVAAQVGVTGALLLALFLVIPTVRLLGESFAGKGPWSLFTGVAVAAVGLGLAGMLSPQLLVVTSLGTFWILVGAAYRLSRLA